LIILSSSTNFANIIPASTTRTGRKALQVAACYQNQQAAFMAVRHFQSYNTLQHRAITSALFLRRSPLTSATRTTPKPSISNLSLDSRENDSMSTKQQHKVGIHWFRNGLRFHDNPALKKACDECETLIPLYVIDPDQPFAQSPTVRVGCIRTNFLLESIREVDQKLRQMKHNHSQMIVV
jgi:DNA photolyase